MYLTDEQVRKIQTRRGTRNHRKFAVVRLPKPPKVKRPVMPPGWRDTAEYRCWSRIKARCFNPNVPRFKDYGGRGIKVCDRWLNSYEYFLADMGRRPTDKHSIDRYPDNNGNYEPGNCRWATTEQQMNNRRNSKRLTFAGLTLSVMQWAERTGVRAGTLWGRIQHGWSVERVLTTAKDRPRGSWKKKKITFRGQTLSLSEWATTLGLSRWALHDRLANGWTLHRALTTPCRNWQKRSKTP